MALKLKKLGHTDLTIFEKSARVEAREELHQDPLQTLSCLQLGKNKTDELNLHQKLRYIK